MFDVVVINSKRLPNVCYMEAIFGVFLGLTSACAGWTTPFIRAEAQGDFAEFAIGSTIIDNSLVDLASSRCCELFVTSWACVYI